MGGQIVRGAFGLCLAALLSTLMALHPSFGLFAQNLIGLFSFLCFVYGFAAACEREVLLGSFQYRGWRAVVVGLGISAGGVALGYLLMPLFDTPRPDFPPCRKSAVPIGRVLLRASQSAPLPAGNCPFQVSANHSNGAVPFLLHYGSCPAWCLTLFCPGCGPWRRTSGR